MRFSYSVSKGSLYLFGMDTFNNILEAVIGLCTAHWFMAILAVTVIVPYCYGRVQRHCKSKRQRKTQYDRIPPPDDKITGELRGKHFVNLDGVTYEI